MMRSRSPELLWLVSTGICLLVLLCSWQVARAATVTLFLKNGDRIAGTLVSENTNSVVISNRWTAALPIPLTEIALRETVPGTTNILPSAIAQKPPGTNAPTTVPPAAAAAVASATPPKTPKPKHWKGEVKLGANFIFGATDTEAYYGRLKLTYEHPYESNPKHFFRNIFDYAVDYGRTDDTLSANRMEGSDKTDFDIGKARYYVYNLASVGYDQIRKIDLQYTIGPGIGYHLITKPAFIFNVETGGNYQAQFRSDNTETKNFYFRFAQDLTWKATKQLTFTEKAEISPQVEELNQFRARAESTLSYGIIQNVSLNLTVLDLYDTQPASGVPNNELQIRSSVGLTF